MAKIAKTIEEEEVEDGLERDEEESLLNRYPHFFDVEVVLHQALELAAAVLALTVAAFAVVVVAAAASIVVVVVDIVLFPGQVSRRP